MSVRRTLLVVLLALALPFSGAAAQTRRDTTPLRVAHVNHAPLVRIPYVLLPDSVRDWFAARWDDTSTTQRETGGCLTYRREVTRMGDTVYWVTKATEKDPQYSSQRAIEFECPPGSSRWHTHTPTTCHSDMWGNVDYGSCVIGGVDAYSCQASMEDRARLRALGVPFALIHCDRRALVPYFPARDGP